MNERSPQILKPTLIAGAITGVVASLPVVGEILMCCTCFSPVIGCGFLAAFLYSRACETAGVGFRAGQGATVGLVAGGFFALVASIVGGIVQAIKPEADYNEIMEQLEQQEGMTPEALDVADQILRFMEDTSPLVLMLLGFFVLLILAAVLSTLGGLIGGAVFKKEPVAPAPTGTEPGAPTPGV